MSTYPIVHVIWTDATLAARHWEDRKDVLARIAEQWAEPIHTAGFLVEETPDRIVVCANVNPGNDDLAHCMVIPRHAISAMSAWTGE